MKTRRIRSCLLPFVLKLNSNGEYLWHTYYGDGSQSGNSLAIDETGNIYVIGHSGHSRWYGPNGKSPLNAHSGDEDMFVLKLSDEP